jgi:thiol-disulfide isomerase/thioredoxin
MRSGLLALAGLIVIAAALLLARPDILDRAVSGPELVGQVQNFAATRTPRERPDIAWKDTAGSDVRLADFYGKLVLVNFWATWCAPCLRELPSMDRLQAKLGSEGLQVVAINVDSGGMFAAEPYHRRLGLTALPLYLDQRSALSRAMGVSVMPTTFLIDRRGREIGRLEGGAEWDSEEAVALLRHYLQRAS